jgi:hypothetical protein
MIPLYRTSILIFLLFFLCKNIVADEPGADKYTISGYLKDQESGEALIAANVFVEELKTGTASNLYGFYSLNLPSGTYTITFSYLGYATQSRKVELKKNTILNMELARKSQVLSEVTIQAEKGNYQVTKSEMSAISMEIENIRKMPALMGEVDVVKAIQLLPGVQAAAEGTSGFSVRGGGIDQNLVLLDEATVYNPSHLMGFFSVFNNDAVKDVKLYKGDIPASYGGRLSSVLDVRMKDGNMKKFSATGGIGTISSRLTLEGPLKKDRTSFIVSGRRTYADIFIPLSGNEDLEGVRLYFYDFNAKLNHNFSDKDRVFLSYYRGRDVFASQEIKMYFDNETFSVRWNHLYGSKLFSNFTGIYNKYNYYLGVPEGEANSFDWNSQCRDYALKLDYNYFLNPNNSLRFGVSTIYHRFDPGTAKGSGDLSFFDEYVIEQNNSLEHGLYVSNEQKFGARIRLKYGFRYSLFQNIGKAMLYDFDRSNPDEYVVTDTHYYSGGHIFHAYDGWEPRLGINFIINDLSSVKASYSRNLQYIHLAKNSTAGTPFDLWFSSSPNIKPQLSDQVAIGYFRNFLNNKIESSVEVYYKNIDNAIDFKDHAELLLNREIEGEFRVGKGWSYGMEFLLKLHDMKLGTGTVNGWISYTLARAWRKIPEINKGKCFLSPYDKPHDISIILNYAFSERAVFSMNWVYSSGAPVTFPVGRAEIGGNIIPVYSDRNDYRMPDYHRLDLALTLKNKNKKNKKWTGEWVFAMYNAYYRKNAWAINFFQDAYDPDNPDKIVDPNKTYAEKIYLFGIVPSITYNFQF